MVNSGAVRWFAHKTRSSLANGLNRRSLLLDGEIHRSMYAVGKGISVPAEEPPDDVIWQIGMFR